MFVGALAEQKLKGREANAANICGGQDGTHIFVMQSLSEFPGKYHTLERFPTLLPLCQVMISSAQIDTWRPLLRVNLDSV